MKIKQFIITLLIIGSTASSIAQPMTPDYAESLSKVSFGVKGGFNFSTQDFNFQTTEESFDLGTASLTSIHFGVFADIPLSEKFGLRPEVLYSKEGAKINLIITDFKQKFDFIKVPVLFRYGISGKLSVHAGPQFGFLVNEELDVDIDDIEIIESAYKSFELSAAIGAEFEISNGFFLGARYNIGLSDMSDTEGASLKNNNFQGYLGVTLF